MSAYAGLRLVTLVALAGVVSVCGAAASSEVAGVRACAAGQLQAWAGLQGATGSQLGGISLTNEAATACVLPSTPRVSLIWRGRRLAVRQVAFPRRWLESEYPRGSTRVHLLQAGQMTYVVLQWWNWCGPRPWGRGYFPGVVEVQLTGRRGSVVVPLREVAAPYCNAPPSTLRVSGFLRPT
jgi:hypothetical protein